MTGQRLWTGLDGQVFTGEEGTSPTSWKKDPDKDTFRRADGAQVHRIAGDEWAAALSGRHSAIPHVIREGCGARTHIRKFPGAQAAMAWLDAEHPLSTKEKVNG